VVVANLTLTECACRANDINARLSAEFNTDVYVVSCEQGGTTVLCENFTCPCSTSRRLLQADDNSTIMNYVYKETTTINAKNETVVVKALEIVLSKPVSITSFVTERLPYTELVWVSDFVYWRRPLAAEDNMLIIAVAASVAGVAILGTVIGVVVWQLTKPKHDKGKKNDDLKKGSTKQAPAKPTSAKPAATKTTPKPPPPKKTGVITKSNMAHSATLINIRITPTTP